MKRAILLVTALCFLFCASSAYSINLLGVFSYNSNTGDKELDATLGNLNAQAKSDPDSFISDLSLSYNVPKSDVENLIHNVKMNFADAYLAIKISRMINKPLDFVVMRYKTNEGKGWGVIAKELGIKPGSDAFHALKQDSADRLEKTKEKNKEKSKSGKGKVKNK